MARIIEGCRDIPEPDLTPRCGKQTPQVSEIFDSRSFGIYANSINPESPQALKFPEPAKKQVNIRSDAEDRIVIADELPQEAGLFPGVRSRVILIEKAVYRFWKLIAIDVDNVAF